METGWVKLHRKLIEGDFWLSEPFTKPQAWVDLFANTNHKSGSFVVRGNLINIARGQIGWSEITMAKRWKWSRNKVRRFLKWLETEQQIKQQKTPVTTIITIINYEQYQSSEQQTEQQTIQQKDNRRYTNKNVKNDKNVKNITTVATKVAHTRNWFIKNKEQITQEARTKYRDKDANKAIEVFIEKTGYKNYGYKDYKLAFFNWIREDRFNEYKRELDNNGLVPGFKFSDLQ